MVKHLPSSEEALSGLEPYKNTESKLTNSFISQDGNRLWEQETMADDPSV